MSDSSHRRLFAIYIALALIGALIIAQLIRLQVIEQADWEKLRIKIVTRTTTLTAPRGRIWDKSGNLVADNVTLFQVMADPRNVNITKAVEKLSPVLNIPPGELRVKLADQGQQALLATRLPLSTGEAVRKLDVWAVYSTPYWQRAYPEHQLLSHVLGFVNAEGKGYYGVEGHYDSLLRG